MKDLIEIINEAKWQSPSLRDMSFIDAYNPSNCKIDKSKTSNLEGYSKNNVGYRSYDLPTKMINHKDVYDIYKPFKITGDKLKEIWDKINSQDGRTIYDEADLIYLDNKDYGKGMSSKDLCSSSNKLTIIPFTRGSDICGVFIIDFIIKKCTELEFDNHIDYIDKEQFKKLFKISEKTWLISSDFDIDKPWERLVKPVEFALQKQLK